MAYSARIRRRYHVNATRKNARYTKLRQYSTISLTTFPFQPITRVSSSFTFSARRRPCPASRPSQMFVAVGHCAGPRHGWTTEADPCPSDRAFGGIPRQQNQLLTFSTRAGTHEPSSTDGGFSFGQYMRIIGMNSPLGAGSQLASLSLPGDSFWK